jgi:hypothetical protein
LLAAGLVAAAATGARADFSNRVLLNAPGAIAGFQTTQNFMSTNGTQALDINVDYAVWAPGTFPGSYTPFSGFAPVSPTDFIYAYQVYDNGPGHGVSTRQFSQLGIDATGGIVDSLGKDVNFDPSGTDVDTNFAFLSASGASYQFLVPAIQVNQFSVVLLLASPQGPSLSHASVFDSGMSASGNVPMPVPAPTTLALLGMGGCLASRRRR